MVDVPTIIECLWQQSNDSRWALRITISLRGEYRRGPLSLCLILWLTFFRHLSKFCIESLRHLKGLLSDLLKVPHENKVFYDGTIVTCSVMTLEVFGNHQLKYIAAVCTKCLFSIWSCSLFKNMSYRQFWILKWFAGRKHLFSPFYSSPAPELPLKAQYTV